jgi:hypothetical protein
MESIYCPTHNPFGRQKLDDKIQETFDSREEGLYSDMKVGLLPKENHFLGIKPRNVPLVLDCFDVIGAESLRVIAHCTYLGNALVEYGILGPARLQKTFASARPKVGVKHFGPGGA